MKRFQLILVVFLGVFVGGCQSLRLMVDNDYSYDTDFTVFKSYAFLNCEIDTSDICSEIHDAIRRQMKARGYVLNEENPDLLVSYSIIKEKTNSIFSKCSRHFRIRITSYNTRLSTS